MRGSVEARVEAAFNTRDDVHVREAIELECLRDRSTTCASIKSPSSISSRVQRYWTLSTSGAVGAGTSSCLDMMDVIALFIQCVYLLRVVSGAWIQKSSDVHADVKSEG